MKTKLTLLTVTTVVLLTVFAFKTEQQDNSPLDGTWQLTAFDYGRGSGKPKVVQLKVLHEGNFEGYVLTAERSAKTMNGKFKVLNDSIYSETLVNALNKPMIGKTYEIKYSLNGNVMITKGSFDAKDENGQAVKGHYNETWSRVDYPQIQ